jgi:hypothetical protein
MSSETQSVPNIGWKLTLFFWAVIDTGVHVVQSGYYFYKIVANKYQIGICFIFLIVFVFLVNNKLLLSFPTSLFSFSKD